MAWRENVTFGSVNIERNLSVAGVQQTATPTEVNQASDLSVQAAKTTQGAAITASAESIDTSVVQHGDIVETILLIDLTGLDATTDDGDVIGKSTTAAYLMQVVPATHGTIFAGEVGCGEVPGGAVTDINVYASSAADGALGDVAGSLADVATLVDSSGAHAIGTVKPMTALPTATADYIYLGGGAAGVPGTYTAGKIYLKLWGYL